MVQISVVKHAESAFIHYASILRRLCIEIAFQFHVGMPFAKVHNPELHSATLRGYPLPCPTSVSIDNNLRCEMKAGSTQGCPP